MKQRRRSKLLRKLLLTNKGGGRLWAALISLCIGTTLLLLSVMIWWNFTELLEGKYDGDSLGSTFLTISKRVTNEKMGKPSTTLFTPTEIDAMKGAPQVQETGVLLSNRFPVFATLNAGAGGVFSTGMFVEAVPDGFIDKKPQDWAWQPGMSQVPMILSSDFLNLYNYGFALSQGLPQLSQSSIQTLAFDLKVGTAERMETYSAHIVGFSDRISSVLVPESFVDYGNKTFAPGVPIAPSRLVVKVKDPSDNAFVSYLSTRDYITNTEQLRWNKMRTVVEAVTSATGLLALILMGIGTIVFILFIELTIARAQSSLTLLLELGYGPHFLSMFMLRRFLPLVVVVCIVSMVLAIGVQVAAAGWLKSMNLNIPDMPGWPVWAALGVSLALLMAFVSRAIVSAINRT